MALSSPDFTDRDFLSEDAARNLVEQYMALERPAPSTQEILDSGAIPRLKGYVVRPGKVSDSIFGDVFMYKGERFENPPLKDKLNYDLRLMVRTERISTHDQLRGTIPFKDQVLATNHHFMRRLVMDELLTSQHDIPGLADNSVVIAAENLMPIPFENVLRAYMAKSSTSTSLYHAYVVLGKREFCGHKLPDDLVPNGPLPYVMDTPSTKSEEHDESVSPQELNDRGLVNLWTYEHIRGSSLRAFDQVSKFLDRRGVILVDVKTEHGESVSGMILSQDELYTMDSARFWLKNDYLDQLRRFRAGEITEISPKSYSKEFARGFSKGDAGYTDEQRLQIAVRYILGLQYLINEPFVPDMRSREERVVTGLQTIVEQVVV